MTAAVGEKSSDRPTSDMAVLCSTYAGNALAAILLRFPIDSSVAILADGHWKEMSKALNPDKSLVKPHSRASNPISAWSPPPSGSIKINCDASWKAGIVVRNHTGMLLDGRRVSISGPSALSCEALALRKACLMGKPLSPCSITGFSEEVALQVSKGRKFLKIRDRGTYLHFLFSQIEEVPAQDSPTWSLVYKQMCGWKQSG
ncbi:hypothetical protein RHGRI_005715 [Rhododendron griersonianum]|uniref:RNase H type-1 domain-containing protein n=1 Tax=Rhododendron griersonianum TaxID=479676 RepID=A0AAV6LFJ6_9ERIC|nr:hypothetical protein RHGRI_005715 [Rhododendron griersonianum]